MENLELSKNEGLHPVTKSVIEKTEKGGIERGADDGFYGDTVWNLLKGEEVRVTYSETYGIYITIRPDGSGSIEDRNNNTGLEFKDWDVGEWAETSEGIYIKDIKESVDFIKSVADSIPSGNLGRMGGVKGLVESFIDIRNAREYAKSESGPKYQNIPTAEVLSQIESD